MKQTLMTLALVAAFAHGVTAADSAQPAEKFRVGYIMEPSHGLHQIALTQGYFKDENLDVELFKFSNVPEGLTAVKTGKLDVGTFGSAGPLSFISKGTDFTIFGGMMIDGQALFTKPENAEHLKTLENFKGKKIGLVRLSTADVILRGLLAKNNVDWRKGEITLVELGNIGAVVQAVQKGEVDAGLAWAPHFSIAEKKAGLKTIIKIADYYPQYSCCRLTANTPDLQKRPDAYKRFLIALIRAYKFYQEKPDDFVKIVSDWLKIDEDIIRKDTYTQKVFDINPDPYKKATLDFWRIMVEVGYIENKTFPIETKINTDIYRQALDEVLKRYPNDPVYAKLDAFNKANN